MTESFAFFVLLVKYVLVNVCIKDIKLFIRNFYYQTHAFFKAYFTVFKVNVSKFMDHSHFFMYTKKTLYLI